MPYDHYAWLCDVMSVHSFSMEMASFSYEPE
jgi:hypothetical protein